MKPLMELYRKKSPKAGLQESATHSRSSATQVYPQGILGIGFIDETQ